jgi:hypothetical protein
MALQTSKPSMQYACVVYDPVTGDVRHVHRVAVLHGAKGPATKEIEARALALAQRLSGGDPSRLKVLHVAPESLKPQMKHKIDPKSLKLVSEPISRKR